MQQSQAGWGETASADRPTTIDDDVDAAEAAAVDEVQGKEDENDDITSWPGLANGQLSGTNAKSGSRV